MTTFIPDIDYYLSFERIRDSVDKYIMDNFAVENGKIVKKDNCNPREYFDCDKSELHLSDDSIKKSLKI